jgi:hypothetical protein
MDNKEAESDEKEEEILVRKIRTLKSVALDLTDMLKHQTGKIDGLEPGMAGFSAHLKRAIHQLNKSQMGKFKSWKYYLISSLVLFILFFILYFLL